MSDQQDPFVRMLREQFEALNQKQKSPNTLDHEFATFVITPGNKLVTDQEGWTLRAQRILNDGLCVMLMTRPKLPDLTDDTPPAGGAQP